MAEPAFGHYRTAGLPLPLGKNPQTGAKGYLANVLRPFISNRRSTKFPSGHMNRS